MVVQDIRCEICVLELLVHVADSFAQVFHLLHHIVETLAVGQTTACAQDRVEHGTELRAELADLLKRLLHDSRELQEAQSVTSRRSVEDNHLVLHTLDLLQHLCETHGLVDTGDAEGHVLEHVAHATETLHGLLCIVAAGRDQVLDGAVGVDLHGGQVLYAGHGSGILAELDAEGVAEVVGWVGGDEQD
jgi:hypothetical protein